MSTSTVRQHPNILERVEYLCGKHLPDSMREWVVRDATGPGHNRRYFIRGTLMFLPFVVAIMFIPTAWWVKAALILMVLVPALYFLSALRWVYLEELLIDNDIDPHTLSGKWRVEHDRRADAYAQKYRSGG